MAKQGSSACRWPLWTSVVLSALGIFVAGYLVAKRFTGGSLACTRWAQCDVVNNSIYSRFYGVPVSVIGLAGYLLLLGLAYIFYLALAILLALMAFLVGRWIAPRGDPAAIFVAVVTFLSLWWFYPLRNAARSCLEDFARFDRLAMDQDDLAREKSQWGTSRWWYDSDRL